MNTSTTDTPRTDEAIEAMGLAALVVPVEICRQLEMELNVSLKNQLEVQAKIARLRELLNRAIEIADEFWKNQKQTVTVLHDELEDELEEIKKVAALATATEEPVIQDSRITEPEWRELGLEEVIQEGDERQDYLHGMVWRKCENSIGTQPKKWPTLKFRTRRQLPKKNAPTE